MDYAEVLTRAWRITWKFKVLWIFGILAGCGVRTGESLNPGFNSTFNTGNGANPNGLSPAAPNLPPGLMPALDQFVQQFADPAFLWKFVAVLSSVACVLLFLQIFCSTMGQVGLIQGASDADGGAEHLGLGALWRAGLHYFWRVFGLVFLIGSPFLLFLLFVGGTAVGLAVRSQGVDPNTRMTLLLAALPVICPLGCLFLLFGIVISFLSPMAQNAIILEDQRLVAGLKRGWRVLRHNLGPILIVWLLLLVIGFAASLLILLPFLLALIPVSFAFFFTALSPGSLSFLPSLVALLCMPAAALLSLLVNGILMTYVQSVWTLTYRRLTRPTALPPGPADPTAHA